MTLRIPNLNSTASFIWVYGIRMPHCSGDELKGLGWSFLTSTEGALKMKGNGYMDSQDAFCGAERVRPLASKHYSLFCDHFLRVVTKHAVLVTSLRYTANCTAYHIQALCCPFPQNEGLSLKGRARTVACSDSTFFASSPWALTWFIPNARNRADRG